MRRVHDVGSARCSVDLQRVRSGRRCGQQELGSAAGVLQRRRSNASILVFSALCFVRGRATRPVLVRPQDLGAPNFPFWNYMLNTTDSATRLSSFIPTECILSLEKELLNIKGVNYGMIYLPDDLKGIESPCSFTRKLKEHFLQLS